MKDRIEFLTGIDSDSFDLLDGVNEKLSELEKSDEEFQNTINEMKKTIQDVTNAKLQWLIL